MDDENDDTPANPSRTPAGAPMPGGTTPPESPRRVDSPTRPSMGTARSRGARLVRLDSSISDLRALQRLHASLVRAGIVGGAGGTMDAQQLEQAWATMAAQGDQAGQAVADGSGGSVVAKSGAAEDGGGSRESPSPLSSSSSSSSFLATSGPHVDDELGVKSDDDDEAGSGSRWFAPLRSSWAYSSSGHVDVEALEVTVGTPTSSSSSSSSSNSHSSLLASGVISPSALDSVLSDAVGFSELDADASTDSDDGEEHEQDVPVEVLDGDVDMDEAVVLEEEEEALNASGTTSVRQQILRSRQGKNEKPQRTSTETSKSPQSSRRRLNLHLRTKSLIGSGPRINLSTSFRLPRRQVSFLNLEDGIAKILC